MSNQQYQQSFYKGPLECNCICSIKAGNDVVTSSAETGYLTLGFALDLALSALAKCKAVSIAFAPTRYERSTL